MVALVRATILILLLAPRVGEAQLADCAALGSGSGAYKVVIDELSFVGAPAAVTAELRNLKELLQFNLSIQLAELRSDVASLRLVPVLDLGLVSCSGRKPTLEGTEFTDARVETLSDQRVVVELWGTLLEGAGGTVAAPHAMIGYVIPPVLHYRPEPALPGRFLIQYPKSDGAPADVLRKLPEASAFALVGLAVKARKARRYDLAVWAYSRGEGRIRDAQQSGTTAGLEGMLSYVRRAACETRENARSDAQYDGPISLTPRENCGGAP